MQITLLLYRSSKQAGWDLDRGGGLVVWQSSLAEHDGPKSNRTTTVRKSLGCVLIWKKIISNTLCLRQRQTDYIYAHQ